MVNLRGCSGSPFTRDCGHPAANTGILRSPKRTQADTFRPSRFQIDLVPDQGIAASASLPGLQLDGGITNLLTYISDPRSISLSNQTWDLQTSRSRDIRVLLITQRSPAARRTPRVRSCDIANIRFLLPLRCRCGRCGGFDLEHGFVFIDVDAL